MYTEFHFNVELPKDTTPKIIALLEHMLKGDTCKKYPFELPDHDLFKTQRWDYMLRCDSYYFSADTHSTLRFDTVSDSYYLCIRCNLKNYGNEIEEFIDWIMPYLVELQGEFLGFYRSEESDEPTLIYKK